MILAQRLAYRLQRVSELLAWFNFTWLALLKQRPLNLSCTLSSSFTIRNDCIDTDGHQKLGRKDRLPPARCAFAALKQEFLFLICMLPLFLSVAKANPP